MFSFSIPRMKRSIGGEMIPQITARENIRKAASLISFISSDRRNRS
jgi:hypothetical protein